LAFFFEVARRVKVLRLYQEGPLHGENAWPMNALSEAFDRNKGLEVLVVENPLDAAQGNRFGILSWNGSIVGLLGRSSFAIL